MYTSILVPLDGSPESERALPIAQALAQRTDATLHLVHVYVPHSPNPIYVPGVPIIDDAGTLHARDHPLAYLAGISRSLEPHIGTITCAVRDIEGSVASTLLTYAEATQTQLVVLTTHGKGGFERAWLGSVADALARSSPIPLLVVRATDRPPTADRLPSKIVIPLDGSALAETAIEHARTLGSLADATYTLLNVVVPTRLHEHSPFLAPVDLDAEGTERALASARQYLEQQAHVLDPTGTRVHRSVTVAPNPALEITSIANQTGAWIVMATHGRSGLRRLFLGSVADKVIRAADTPILLCRPTTMSDAP